MTFARVCRSFYIASDICYVVFVPALPLCYQALSLSLSLCLSLVVGLDSCLHLVYLVLCAKPCDWYLFTFCLTYMVNFLSVSLLQ